MPAGVFGQADQKKRCAAMPFSSRQTISPNNLSASGRDATRRRRHEFRADLVRNGFAQDPIDLGPG
jgi:hypothetical protein